MASTPARKQARTRQTRTSSSRAHSHEADSDGIAALAQLPPPLQHAIVTRNIAASLRAKATRDQQTMEVAAASIVVKLATEAPQDDDAIVSVLKALCLIAAEDDRRGAGPLRVVEAALTEADTRDLAPSDIIVDALVPAISPAQVARAQRLAASWAASLPSGVVWHEALHAANGYEGVTDQMTTILSGNEGASDFDWDCDAYNNALQLTGWLLAEAFHATVTTAQAVRS